MEFQDFMLKKYSSLLNGADNMIRTADKERDIYKKEFYEGLAKENEKQALFIKELIEEFQWRKNSGYYL